MLVQVKRGVVVTLEQHMSYCVYVSLKVFQILGTPILLETIHVFWKKLQILEYEEVPEEKKWDLKEECEELKIQFSALDIVGQRVLKKKSVTQSIHQQLQCVHRW